MIDLSLPGDKSISHRSFLLGSLCEGESFFENLSKGADVRSTAECLRACGLQVSFEGPGKAKILGGELKNPSENLDCGNSGTTARLLTGLLVGQGIEATLVGDSSLSSRPMGRIIDPLSLMGARIDSQNGKFPLKTFSMNLKGIDYEMKVGSAQVKSCMILAHLFASSPGSVKDPFGSRDHTERMLMHIGAPIVVEGEKIHISPLKGRLSPFHITVPADPSSGAFFAAAALISERPVRLMNLLYNPTRIGFFRVIERMGAKLHQENLRTVMGEEVCDLVVEPGPLNGFSIEEKEVPSLVDEIPMLTVLATLASGRTIIRGAEELRHKECDRIHAMISNFRNLGLNIVEYEDGLELEGSQSFQDGDVQTFHDHRIAMSFAIAGLTGTKIRVDHPECVGISLPGFYEYLEQFE